MAGLEHDSGVKILFRGELHSPLLETHALSPFFNYGRGFFETILYEKGDLDLFDQHRERMRKTARDFHFHLDWDQIAEQKIETLLIDNNLSDKSARVKILYAPISDASRWDTVITAAPYTRPVNDFVLSIHPEINDTSLNRYKSLNYGFNLHWKTHYSKKKKSHEVLFLNRKGHVLEGSYTNVLVKKDSVLYYVGKDQNYLQGVMQDFLLQEAINQGEKVKALKEGIPLDFLKNADEVFVCNSLLKLKKVRKIH